MGLQELVTPQPHTSATLSTTLRDSYGTVGTPVPQGPNQQFRDTSAPWGIPTQDAPSARSGLRRLGSWSPGVIDAGIAGICAFSFVIDPLKQVARLALEDAAHRIQSRQADGLGATVLEYCDVGWRS